MKFIIALQSWTAKASIEVEGPSLAIAITTEKANLRGANLYGANLYGADLRGANLYGANLYGADLYGANLRGADLRGADLRGANLRGADLRGANLYGADLRGANLYGANLYGADLYGADLRGANLYGADLRGANLRGADLRGANLRGADDKKIATLVSEGKANFSIGPIGSRQDTLIAFNTDKGILVSTGCFHTKPLAEFAKAVKATHKNNIHAKAYLVAVELMKLAFKEGA